MINAAVISLLIMIRLEEYLLKVLKIFGLLYRLNVFYL